MKTKLPTLQASRHLASLLACSLVMVSAAKLRAEVTVGLHFVEGSDEPIDFLMIPGFVYPPGTGHYIQPWQMTDPGNQFVLDGSFAGKTEAEVRAAVASSVAELYDSIPTPQGFVLDIDFQIGKVSGPRTVSVLIGKYTLGGSWFGYSQDGGGLGSEADGASNSAISVDRIDSQLQVDFVDFDDAVNAISNTIAHEVGHLLGLDHVWAAVRPDLGWLPSDPVVTNPFDVMATAVSGLPDAGWIQGNVFSAVPATQSGGLSSVERLIQTVGLKWGDSPLAISLNGTDFELRWPSRPGMVYDLLSNSDLATPAASWQVYDPDGPGGDPPHVNLLPSGTGINCISVSPTDSRCFYAVREKVGP